MNPNADVPLRRTLYPLLIAVAMAIVCGHILSASRVSLPHFARPPGDTNPDDHRGRWPTTRPEPVPNYGDNDRSRWDTVRALVDNGEYRIGHRDSDPAFASTVALLASPSGHGPLLAASVLVPGRSGTYYDSGICAENGWVTIDKVMRPDTHDFHSSKPPLLPTLVAGEYWLLKHVLGWSIFNDRETEHDQRWLVMRTILLTINALPFLVYLLVLARLAERFGQTDWGRLFVVAAGGFGTFLTTFAVTFNNHSIATCTALFALYPALLVWAERRQELSLYLLAGFFAGFTATCEFPAAAFAAALFVLLLIRSPARTLLAYVPAAAVPVLALLLTNYLALGTLQPAYEHFGTGWYEFEGSHWKVNPGEVPYGIDWAYLSEGRAVYGFHVLFGHHGLFALTPVFLLAVAGVVASLARRRACGPGTDSTRPAWAAMALLTLAVSVIVIGFYIVWVNDRNRNYGGWTCAPRWLMWLTPLFLVTMLPVADWLAGRRWGRAVGLLLLALSVVSASYPACSPWTHPWIYNWMESQGWLPY
jgi:hypothetical protein